MELARMVLISLLLILPLASSFSTNILRTNLAFKDGDLLISEGKNFALGFFSPGSSKYRYLGIWFHEVSLQTVVWVANRNNPVKGSSGLLSVKEGNLVLYNNKSPVWSTNLSMGTNDTLKAKLLDSGNLVLVDRNNRMMWQSFDYLTNTLIPGMKLGLNKKTGHNKFLSSWKSANDPGPGKYSYRLNPTGSPQIFLHNGTRPYWRTRPWPWKPFPDVVFIDFINNAEEIYHNFSVHDPSLISRVLLDDTGFLKAMIWNKNESEWKLFFTLPRDRCDYHGGCGAYGKCDSHAVNRFECICLPGYEPKSPQDWYVRDGRGGCVRKRRDSMSICGNEEGFLKLESVKLPDALVARWIDMRMSRTECEMECKKNCSCSAYSSIENDGGTSCLAWYGDLIDITTYRADFGNDLYVRVDALELESVKGSNGMKRKPLIISVASAWLVIIIIIFCWIRNKKKKGGKNNTTKRRMFDPKNEKQNGSSNYPDMVFFDFSTMVAATDNFSSANRIGQGGFGTVYKGQLSNGQEIAVKRMSKNSKQGIEEFKNEVMLIAKLQHKNLVKLLGCCIEKKEQLLIYEYLPNKSLDAFLFDERKKCLLDWEKRFNILVGIARGILYLHQDSRLTIIHRDLKTSNVLLDEKMNPKISDFGMARMFQSDQIQVVTKRVVGTYGYMPPEYAMFGKFSVKSDVFSFGIILLEIMSGKKSNGFHQQDDSLSLAGHVWELWSEGRAMEIVDSSLIESYNPDEALRCIQVGLLCVQEDAMERPTMLEVILMLKSETPLPCPKEPAFIFKTSSSNTKSPGEEEDGKFSINDLTLSAIVTR
ncbi:S-locus lectin protein kinase family protein [Euphorbia peplus]|nr:S-locus lectin protein kinase family protein [Euphorbia peplus]